MKQKHMLSLMQDNYTTVQVLINPKKNPDGTFAPGSMEPMQAAGAAPYAQPSMHQPMPTEKTYTFKVLLTDNIKVDDYVVVFTTRGLKTGLVTQVDNTPKIDLDADYDYKWIVQKLDIAPYMETLQKEADFNLALVEIERQKKREEFRKSYMENFEGNDLLSDMFNGAVQSLNQVIEQDDNGGVE